MSDYVTLREASKLVNRSVVTIRRRVKHTMSTQKDTQMITHGDKGEYLISKAWIITEYGHDNTQKDTQQILSEYSNDQSLNAINKAIEALTNQLEAKDSQIEQLIKAQERSDILLRELQQRLPALPANIKKPAKKEAKKKPQQNSKSKKSNGWFDWLR